ncbi:MAG: HAD family hydrolase [Planctomycetota bacterium]|nr:HAD family hydrolase [Planctomycetota bacterium]
MLFDLDGTLVATDRFWPDAARAGALRAFAALGLERELPTSEQWMSMVGLPMEEGFDRVFEDLDPVSRRAVLEACEEEEKSLLEEGRMGLLPGVQAALEELKERGVAIGVASNCSQSYLDSMLQAGGLSEWVQESRCLDTPGIRNKADMIQELLILFQTRSAVMVGDRAGDRHAAWANGLPHVHLTRGYADHGEGYGAEAMLPGMDGLIPRLLQRSFWLQDVLGGLGMTAPSGVLLLVGPMGGGKQWLARDLVRALEQRGQSAVCVDTARLCADSLQSLTPEELEDGDRVLAPRRPTELVGVGEGGMENRARSLPSATLDSANGRPDFARGVRRRCARAANSRGKFAGPLPAFGPGVGLGTGGPIEYAAGIAVSARHDRPFVHFRQQSPGPGVLVPLQSPVENAKRPVRNGAFAWAKRGSPRWNSW